MAADKLFIKWDSCKCYEHIDVVRCFKCLGFNHYQKECTNKRACKYCAEEHLSAECKSIETKCVNCLWHVKNLNIKLDVNHDAFYKNCPVFERKYQQEKRKVESVQ